MMNISFNIAKPPLINWIKKGCKWLLQGLYLQCYLALITFPILIAWGLPYSIMTYVGNILFNPFLILFLFLASCIFFLELLHIPNGILVTFLEYVTRGWLWIAQYGRKEWLIYSRKSALGFLIIIAFTIVVIMCFCKVKNKVQLICVVFLLFISLFFSLCKNSKPLKIIIPCNNKTILAIDADQGLCLIDDGALATQRASGWIEHGLSKELVKQFGTPYIDTVICTKLSLVTLDHPIELCKISAVKNIYLVTWQGQADKKLLKKYGLMRFLLQKNKGQLHRIKPNQTLSIPLTNNLKIILKTNSEQVHYNALHYPNVRYDLKT